MTNKNSGDTGGPAFPLYCPITQEHVSYTGYTNHDFTMGMTLRDYFAAKALQAILGAGISSDQYKDDAEQAYVIADAMIEARNGQD
jgi:hypothetical protein